MRGGETDGSETRAVQCALRDPHSSSSSDARRKETRSSPSPRDSRRMSEGEGACEGREMARPSTDVARGRHFFSKSTSPPFQKSILTSGRDKLLGLLDGLDGSAELLPRGELLAGGRHREGRWGGSGWGWGVEGEETKVLLSRRKKKKSKCEERRATALSVSLRRVQKFNSSSFLWRKFSSLPSFFLFALSSSSP